MTGFGRRATVLPPKNLLGMPWRVAFALQADGWFLRQEIIWSKPNPMPESVRDRCLLVAGFQTGKPGGRWTVRRGCGLATSMRRFSNFMT
jgi:hypothetical protein